MNAITLDTPLLLGGLLWLLWLRFFAPAYRFQLACQLVGTIWAQYSFILSWSLAKFVPILSSTTWYPQRVRGSLSFLPFIVYTIFGGVILSSFWNIPSHLNYAYGEGRLWVQLVTFLSLVLCTRAYAAAQLTAEAPLLMWKVVVLIGIIHGLAFVYQYFAAYFGLPVIGISRSHGLTLDGAAGDVAAYVVGGINILRPGGLAGEPKTVAILFGIVLVVAIVCGNPVKHEKKWSLLYCISVPLSGICFILAFSTSAYIGFFACIVSMLVLGVIKFSGYIKGFLLFLLLVVVLDSVLSYADLPTLADLFTLRFHDRILGLQDEGGMDPPVEAAIQIMAVEPLILLFGTGIGGGTFYIQDYLATTFEYALVPNIGGVNLLFEHGIIGTLFLLCPFFLLLAKVHKRILSGRRTVTWEWKFLFSLGVSSMMFMLSGSGISLGYPLAIGSLLAATNIHGPKPRGSFK